MLCLERKRTVITLASVWILLLGFMGLPGTGGFNLANADETAKPALPPGEYAEFDTSMGTIVCQLFPQSAPHTVENFVGLAEGTKEFQDPQSGKMVKRPFYDGLVFHRVIKNFMIQGGDPLGNGTGGPGYQFDDEIDATRDFSHKGVLAMANAGPNTNGSQFFIITGASGVGLPPLYSLFGQVVSGMDAVMAMDAVGSSGGRPAETVTIEKVEITEAE